ncbi:MULTISPECIES: C39 family peptidase [unclassified Inquilinus]|uniref:C39 family peptidase n=1 Tax=unclassified Inquilinus TaxID=2645927 RepID=UPI003F9012DA
MDDISQRAPASPVPYFSQWESPDRAEDILAGRLPLAEDPNWAKSGATDAADYARWADHICGMACLKMVLAARTGRAPPLLELARGATAHGGYVVEGEAIKGLIYAPFVAFVRAEFGLSAQIVTGITARGIPGILRGAQFFIASVHPSIRRPESEAPAKGGHLVLVHGFEDGRLVFHNPSGHDRAAREAVALPVETFDRFFAGRGIAILP